MPEVKTAESVQLTLEISRHPETKDYLKNITDNLAKSRKLGAHLNPQQVLNTYISAVAKCAVALINLGVLRQNQVNSSDVSHIAYDLAKNALK